MEEDNTSPNNLVHLNQKDIHMRKEQHYNKPVQYLSHFIDKQNYVS
jgi:predicted phosphatase